MSKNVKITVVGAGYVGMSLAVLLAQHNEVVVLDIDPLRVAKINDRKSTVSDADISTFLSNNKLNLSATLDRKVAFLDSSYIIIATPTDYDETSNCFDTSSVDGVIREIFKLKTSSLVVIKSTVPVGYTRSLQKKYRTNKIIFSPEFLREGQALRDNLHPSRVIVGDENEHGKGFADLLTRGP